MEARQITERLKVFESLETVRGQLSQLKHDVLKFYKDLLDSLNCPIKYDTISEPVLTPCGVTYDKLCIENHLKSKRFDPLSRQPLNPKKLLPNLMVKSIISVVKKYNFLVGMERENQEDRELQIRDIKIH